MQQRLILSIVAMTCFACFAAHFAAPDARADETPACGTLESATGGDIALREGESVNFTHAGKLTHGVLHVYKDVEVYRVYWQPIGSSEQYVLANEGINSVRLIATPTRGAKVDAGPGMLPPQLVLSCPAL